MEQTNKEKLVVSKKNKRKIIIILTCLAIISSYCIYIVISLIRNPTDIFVVENGKLYLDEPAIGYIIREEQIVGDEYKNGIEKLKSEGERIAKGEPIFRYYSSNESSINEQIKEIDLKRQEAISKLNNSLPNDIKLLNEQIDEKLDSIFLLDDIQKINEYKKELNLYIEKKAKIAGEQSPAGSYIRKLDEERASLVRQKNAGSKTLEAPITGIVSYRVDGLESILTPDSFSSLSKETLEKLSLKTGQIITSSDEKGKIINNFKCYIAAVLSSDRAKEANVGDSLNIRLSNLNEIPAEITYIADEENGDRVLVFEIEKNVEELISYRKISFDVVWWSFSGLKIPNDAIGEENDLNYIIRNRARIFGQNIYKSQEAE